MGNKIKSKKIKKGDKVIVITGKYKGQSGEVLSLIGDDKLLVKEINMVKKHLKTRTSPEGQVMEGRIIDKEQPIHRSNVALLNLATHEGDKVGFKTLEDGSKVRYFKSNNEIITDV